MRDDIKKHLNILKSTIRENSEIVDDELISMIKNYRGDNKMIIDFQGKVIKNFDLTPKQKESARDFFSNDKLKKTILSSLDSSNELGKKVIRKGIETYLSLLKTNKKYLFKPKEGRNVKVDRPSEGWIKKNIEDLEKFKEKLSNEQLCQWVELSDGGGVLKNKIDEVLDILQNNPESFFGFIENGDWSVVNKIDTNTINWFRMIAELDSENKLKGNTPEEKVEFFFEQIPVEKLLHTKSLNGLKELEEQYGIKIPTLSLAEYEVLKDFNIDFQNVKKRIMKSTGLGDKNEENIKGTFLSQPVKAGQARIHRKGFTTTNKTKLAVCAKLKNLVENRKIIISSKNLISELKTFVASGAGFAAKVGETDDLVTSLLLVLRVIQALQSYDSELDEKLRDTADDYIAPMPFIML